MAMSYQESMLQEFNQEAMTTKRVLERVPAALLSLKDSPRRVQEFEVHRTG